MSNVILPMTVLRRLDAILEPTKKAVIDMKASLDTKKIVNQKVALRQASGQPLRSLEEVRADILALENETEGLLGEIIGSKGVNA